MNRFDKPILATRRNALVTFVGPIRSEDLNDLVRALLGAAGTDFDDARLVAEQLVDAEARENRGQGLIRLRPYVNWMRNGKIASPAKLKVEREFGATLLLDGNNGWGQVVTTQAMTMCVERAQRQGVCLALLRNSNHIGRLGYYVEIAAGDGFVGLVACSGHPSSAWVAPWGGTKPIFGTNPIAFGFPRKVGPPVVVDLSTTQGARGHVLLAAKLGKLLPEGWALDAAGYPTRDPSKALPPHGTLTPLGGHKGYALALAVEILCGVLSGMWPPSGGAILVGAVRVEAFQSLDDYHRSLDNLLDEITSGPTGPDTDAILIPGQGSAQRGKKSCDNGLRIPEELWSDVVALARDLGVQHRLIT
jgi:LDH2 family malate/lactate/ureidoglycolate dehydrogenase